MRQLWPKALSESYMLRLLLIEMASNIQNDVIHDRSSLGSRMSWNTDIHPSRKTNSRYSPSQKTLPHETSDAANAQYIQYLAECSHLCHSEETLISQELFLFGIFLSQEMNL